MTIAAGLPKLYAVVDAELARRCRLDVVDLWAACLEGGARLLQLRAKGASGRDLCAWGDAVVALSRESGASVIVNDRADVALAVNAAGVHVGQDDLPPSAVRALCGPDALIGFSTHTRDQVCEALPEPVSYIAVGPIFGTATKDTGYEAVGLELVRIAAEAASPRPVVAIGGITLENAPSVLAAGASAVAVISDLLVTGDPRGRVRAYLDTLG